MSGASPQGLGVAIGPFPGCQETSNGSPGQTSYYIPPTGVDANGCPVGGSIPSVDDFNGIFQALNCILTKGGTEPLPIECFCADPCMLYDKIVDIINELAVAAICNIGDATQNQKNAIEANPALAEVVVCYNGVPIKVPSDCLGANDDDGGGTTTPQDCEVTFTSSTQFNVVNGPVIVCEREILPNPNPVTYKQIPSGSNVTIGQGSNLDIFPNSSAPPTTAPLITTRNIKWQQAQGENYEVEYEIYCIA